MLTTFDNVTDDVFGTQINLATDVGAMLCTGHFDPTTGVTAHCTSTPDSSKLTLDASGPAPPGSSTPVPGQQQPFVVNGSNVTGTVATAIGSASYTVDGAQTVQPDPSNPQLPEVLSTNDISGCPLTGPVVVFIGNFGMNAFQAVATTTGSDVPVSTSATYTNPLQTCRTPLPSI